MAAPKDKDQAAKSDETSTAKSDQPTRPENRPAAVYYRPQEGVHLTKAGDIALGNWTGKVDDQTHWVYYGAPIASVPPNVRAAMKKSRIGFGRVTKADFDPVPNDRTLPLPNAQPES